MAASTTQVGNGQVTYPSLTTSTNLGPLPSTSFPAYCMGEMYDMQRIGLAGGPWSYLTQGCALKTCCPSSNFYSEEWAWMTSYYSPGVCPAEYRSCQPPPATGVQSLSSSDGETIAFCCPTNYDCPYDGSGPFSLCISELSTSTSVIVLNNIYQQQTVSTRSFTVPSGDAYMYEIAYPIQVRYKEGEAIPTGAVSSSSSNVGGAVLSQSQSSPSDGSSGSKSGGGLSGGAIAGIVIGAIAGLALMVVAVLLLLMYQKNKPKQVSPSSEGADVVNSAYAGDEKQVGSPPAAPPVALHTKPQVSPNNSQIGVAHAKVAELDTRYTQQFASPDAHQLDSTFAQPVGYVEMPTQQYNPGTNYIAELPSKQ